MAKSDKVDEAQARRDRHYFEDGVDEQGNAPEGVYFDEHGQSHPIEEPVGEPVEDEQPSEPTPEEVDEV